MTSTIEPLPRTATPGARPGVPPGPGSPQRGVTGARQAGPRGGDAGEWAAVAGPALGWASLLVVAGLWLTSGGISGVHTAADAWSSLGRLTGLVSSDLLLLQVLLMARIPPLERAIGQDALARGHRLVGFTSFTLMWAHIVLILVGYAGADLGALWATTVDTVLSEPAMLLAVLGTVCLCLVVLTSVRRARARLRYESWHLLHLYAYLGCFLALPHQLWTGADFLASPLATAYWWTLWALAAGTVLAFRVGLPVLRNVRHRLVVVDVRRRGQITIVTVTGRDLAALQVAGGQFFQWRFLSGAGWTRAHPYSLSAAPDGRSLEISVAAVGAGSAGLAGVQPGTRVLIEGPYGRLHAGVRTRRRVLLLAAGIGVAPLKALLESLPGQPGQSEDVVLIHRVARAESAALGPEIAASAERVGARVILLEGHRLTERASWLPNAWAHVGDADALRHLVPDVAERDVFLCGGAEWVDAAERAALAAGVPAEQVHAERFSS